uniref:C-type lectin domain-containing protein n=1 Tax=Cyprinodon variegatus TaxID=28743 RepID=A0A3Q2D9N7_CYPVA
MKLLVLCVLVFSEMEWSRADPVPDNGSADEDLVQRSASCPPGWSEYNNNCYNYVPRPMDWASAERTCISMGGHLASIHDMREHQEIQHMIRTASYQTKPTWIGGYNAQQTEPWFWSDGSRFVYTSWCPGEPNNTDGQQHCLQMNHSADKCWDDLYCGSQLPSLCKMKVEAV